MRWRGVARARSARRDGLRSRLPGIAAVTILSVLLGGCSSNVPTGGRFAAEGATVAFESIDGPPPAVFDNLVSQLGKEADARQVPVVSRSEPATYRVRGYVSAIVDRGKVSFAWVWDVYDASRRRTLRLSGEEPAGSRHRDAWAGADDAVVRRIAGRAMEGLAAFLNDPRTPGPPTPDGETAIRTAALGPRR